MIDYGSFCFESNSSLEQLGDEQASISEVNTESSWIQDVVV